MALKRQNTQMQMKLAATVARTDHDITDEDAGEFRLAKAKESEEKKRQEVIITAPSPALTWPLISPPTSPPTSLLIAPRICISHPSSHLLPSPPIVTQRFELKRHATQNQLMVQSTASRTDHDITDDAAGFARSDVAAASRARKDTEERERAAKNREIKARIASTAARTDDDVTDDAAGACRTRAAWSASGASSSSAGNRGGGGARGAPSTPKGTGHVGAFRPGSAPAGRVQIAVATPSTTMQTPVETPKSGGVFGFFGWGGTPASAA